MGMISATTHAFFFFFHSWPIELLRQLKKVTINFCYWTWWARAMWYDVQQRKIKVFNEFRSLPGLDPSFPCLVFCCNCSYCSYRHPRSALLQGMASAYQIRFQLIVMDQRTSTSSRCNTCNWLLQDQHWMSSKGAAVHPPSPCTQIQSRLPSTYSANRFLLH